MNNFFPEELQSMSGSRKLLYFVRLDRLGEAVTVKKDRAMFGCRACHRPCAEFDLKNANDNSNDGVHLVPVEPGDQEFLRSLYATTRDDIWSSDLAPELKQRLVDFQFQAQHDHYMKQFAGANFDLICQDGKPIGRLYVCQSDSEIRLIDIAIMPDERGKRIGTNLIGDLLRHSGRVGLPVRLRVEPNNPALRLYLRLGFQVIADEQVNLHMEWQPKTTGWNRIGEQDGNESR